MVLSCARCSVMISSCRFPFGACFTMISPWAAGVSPLGIICTFVPPAAHANPAYKRSAVTMKQTFARDKRRLFLHGCCMAFNNLLASIIYASLPDPHRDAPAARGHAPQAMSVGHLEVGCGLDDVGRRAWTVPCEHVAGLG